MSIRYIDLSTAMRIVTLQGWVVRDHGLLDSALHRPRSEMFGTEFYPTLDLKAASLLHSIVGNHCLVDGNKRLGWLCANVFLRLNGDPCLLDDDSAVELVMEIASGELSDVELIAKRLRS